MSSTITALTSGGGLAMAGDTSGQLELKTNNGTTAVTVTTAQNVGVGITSPTNKLYVSTNSTTATAKGLSIANTAASTANGAVEIDFYTDQVDGSTLTNKARITGSLDASNSALGYLAFSTNNSTMQERMRITSAGDIGIGNTGSSTFKFNVTGAGTTSATYAFRAEDSTTNNLLSARNDGAINTGTRTSSPYNNTVANAANMYVTSDGFLTRSTSSLKYKTDVQDAIHGLNDLLKLRSVTYKGKSEHDGDKVYGGLIAEEVDAAGLSEFVQYAEDESPDALAYGNMVALCVKAIQELNAKVDAQALEIQALKGVA